MNKDLIEVIRCKDCSYGVRVVDQAGDETDMVLCHHPILQGWHDKDWYCAGAESDEG